MSLSLQAQAALSQGLVFHLVAQADVRIGVDRGDGVSGTLTPYPVTALDETDNPLAALRQLLLEIPEILAAVGATGVYLQKLPLRLASDGTPNPPALPCILIYSNADRTNPNIPSVWAPTFTVKCYGDSQSEASAVYRILKAKDGTAQQTTNFRFHYLEEMTSQGDILEQITESKAWDCVSSQWSAEISKLI